MGGEGACSSKEAGSRRRVDSSQPQTEQEVRSANTGSTEPEATVSDYLERTALMLQSTSCPHPTSPPEIPTLKMTLYRVKLLEIH